MEIANKNNYEYFKTQDSNFVEFEMFHFFDYRTIEQKENICQLKEIDNSVIFEFCDLTFSEGGLTSKEIYHVTVFKQKLKSQIPAFMLKREELVDRFFERVKFFGQSKDINFIDFPDFSKQYLIRGNDFEGISKLFDHDLIEYLDKKAIELIECNGDSVIMILHDGMLKSANLEKELIYFKQLMNLLS